jgi:DNA modification methylase/ParB-like chromosome segregation protein Spo0J
VTTTPVIQNTMIKLADLAPHPSNYRTHPESQIQDLMASLLRFGQVKSIVIQEGPHPLCVAGHGIVEAARRLNYSELRADVIPADWSPADVKGYLIADNQHAANAIDDEAILASLLQEQHDLGLDLAALGTDEEALRQLIASVGDEYLAGGGSDGGDEQGKNATLAERFIIPPFSVLDARQGYWQERKRAWIALGIQSELGRGDLLTWTSEQVTEPGLNYYRSRSTPEQSAALLSQKVRDAGKGFGRTFGQDLMRGEHVVGQNSKRLTWVAGDRPVEQLDETSRKILAGGRKAADQRSNLNGAPPKPSWASGTGTENMAAGTSIFDPVLCELAYRWFSPPDGVVLDPFAGGSVRGIVAAKTGRQYIGIDLSAMQIAANEQQWQVIRTSGPMLLGDMVPIKVSAASARLLFHGCDPAYIRDVCHARCCESSTSPTGTMITIHPREEYTIQERGGVVIDGLLQPRKGEKKCPFKTGENLCSLHFTSDKPFGCIASPFTLHASGDTLIVRNRYKMLVCYNNDPKHGVPMPAYKAFRASLDLIFGKDEAERICTHFDNGGGDITAQVTRQNYDMLRDNDAIKKGHTLDDMPVEHDGSQPTPQWIVGDSRNIDTLCADIQADLIFTCPPYYDLEVYSDNEHDLSTAFSYDDFLLSYRAILKQAIAKLKDNRFVCLVVGDIRDKKGFYRNFVSDTITACQDAGARLYNEAILVTSVGSLPIRVGKQFSSGRKLGKTHQNVLVFCKGDPIQAVKDCGPVVVEVPEEADEEEGEAIDA